MKNITISRDRLLKISLACKTVTIGTKERTTLFKGQGSEDPLQVRVIKNRGNEFSYHTVELALKKSDVSCGFGEQKSPVSSWRQNHRNEFLSDMVELALRFFTTEYIGKRS